LDRLSILSELASRLQTASGLEFEKAVADAFGFLGFKAEVIEETIAESDVIIEAKYAENPYYVVVECCAVLPHNQVPYDKLGQIRGNFPRYMDERRQRLFKTAYKLIVGRPEFSAPTKTNSEPDVGLMSVDVLNTLLEYHEKYNFSQDELERILKTVGEIINEHVLKNLVLQYERKLEIYSIIYISLLEDPYSQRSDSRIPFTPVEQIVGEVKAYTKLLRMPTLSDDEINNAVRDLSNPFLKFIDIKGSNLRLSSLPFESIKKVGGQMGNELALKDQEFLSKLRRMQSLT